jgi:lipopolysaccharide export LptBFGC system permease protein LptF
MSMAIIDRYLLRQFLGVFAVFFLSLYGLFIVGDTVNHFGEVTHYARSHGGVLKFLAEYYGFRSLMFFDWMNSLLVLVAAMFTIASFRRHNEMTALMAAGIRNARIIRPILIAAGVLVLLAVINRELLLPSVRGQLSTNFKDMDGKKARVITPMYDNETDILLSGSGLLLRTRRIKAPNFFLPRSLDHYGQQLIAAEAMYHAANKDRPSGYLLEGVVQPEDLDQKSSLRLHEKLVILTPHDTDWLAEDECFVVSQVEPQALTGGGGWQKMSSASELIASLKNPSVKNHPGIEVEFHSRFVQPFLDMNLLLLGLPIVLTRQSRNLFLSVGFCVLLIVVFMAVIMLCHSIGESAVLSPSLAAWCPLILFLPLAVMMSTPLYE